MAFQTVPNVASFRMHGNYGAALTDIINTIYIRNTLSPWTSTHLITTATALGNAWRDNVCPQLANTYRFVACDYRDEGAEFGVNGSVAYNTLGSLAGNPVTPMTCGAVRIKATNGPPRQGHWFISPLTEDVLAQDATTGGYQTALLAACNAVGAVVAVAGDAHVIVSRYSKSDEPTPPHKRAIAVSDTVLSYTVYSRLFVQRDRRPEIGS